MSIHQTPTPTCVRRLDVYESTKVLVHGARVKTLRPIMARHACRHGNPLASLYPKMMDSWWSIIEDIFSSPAADALQQRLTLALLDHDEMESISIDGTLRCTLSLLGQARPKASAEQKAVAAFQAGQALRRVITVRGRTGAVLTIEPAIGEDSGAVAATLVKTMAPNALNQVRFLATDCPSLKLWDTLRRVLPNLQIMCLDTVHLGITYEYGFWRKHTPGSTLLRTIMSKFTVYDPELTDTDWGPAFNGSGPKTRDTREEKLYRDHIWEQSMCTGRAKRVLAELNTKNPFRSRLEFIEAVAALASLHADEMTKMCPGPNKPVYQILHAATAFPRTQWYFNNLRLRYTMARGRLALLPSGTASNEALHAEINRFFRQTQSMHHSTFRLKLRCLRLSKQLVHHAAMYYPTLRQISSSMVQASLVTRPMWDETTWSAWCNNLQLDNGKTRKSDLQLAANRKEERKEIRDAVLRRPAAASEQPKGSGPKRTPFTRKREGTRILNGVRRTVMKRPSAAT